MDSILDELPIVPTYDKWSKWETLISEINGRGLAGGKVGPRCRLMGWHVAEWERNNFGGNRGKRVEW